MEDTRTVKLSSQIDVYVSCVLDDEEDVDSCCISK